MFGKRLHPALISACLAALWFAACGGDSQHRSTGPEGGTGAQGGAAAGGSGGTSTGGQATGGGGTGGTANRDSGTDANSDSGTTSSCDGSLGIFDAATHAITATSVDPPFGCACADTIVTIHSSSGSFVSTPRVEMRPTGQASPVTLMTRVAFVDSSTLTAVVPKGVPVGPYDVTVVNPPFDGGVSNSVPFSVVSKPIPTIAGMTPNAGDPLSAGTPTSIYGNDFRDPVKVELIDRSLSVVATVNPVTPTTATQIDLTLPTSGMGEDSYLVRVTDLDEATSTTFSSFHVESMTGPLATPVAMAALGQPRRLSAAATARDDRGDTYLYVLGGDSGTTGDSGTGGAVLGSVEVAKVSDFGVLEGWQTSMNALTTPRDAPVLVAVPIFDTTSSFIPVKTYLYATGGRDGAGAVLGSVERAMVLRATDAPQVTSITSRCDTGTLTAGTWYYRVSAVLDPNDPDNPGGETLPSDEAILTTGGGAITLSWTAPTINGKPPVSYRVYRTATANGISLTEVLIATVQATTYLDAGATPGMEKPLFPGSVGAWKIQSSTHAGRWGHQAAVITDGTGARFLYVLGGKSDSAGGYLDSIESSPIDAAGGIGSFGSTGTTALSTARAFFSLVVETSARVPGYTGVARLITLGGVEGAGPSAELELSDVVNGGGNGAWSAYAGTGSLNASAGPAGFIQRNLLVALGGATAATTTAFSNLTNLGRQVPFTSTGDLASPIQPSTAFSTARALSATVSSSGFAYVIGGSSDGTNAVGDVVQVF